MKNFRSPLCLVSVLAVAFGLIALLAHWGNKDVRERAATAGAKFPPPGEWTQPATMAHYADVDGNYWFLYTRQMLTDGVWRVHHTTLDNTPHGRGVFWSSSYSWWMILLAKSRALALGGTALDYLAWAGDWGEAFLHALWVLGFVAIFWRRAGMARTAVGALLLATFEPIASDHAFARPDHHGLHDGIALMGFACMARAFWPGEMRRRGWMLASAFFCAMGMWVGATAQFFILGVTALGGCAGAFVGARESQAAAEHSARLWRLWGWAGGGFALAFYALEYAPGPWPFHLEVNHPLFALAWIGLGEFTARLRTARAVGKWITPGLCAAGLAVAQLPAVILSLPIALYTPRDPVIIATIRLGVETAPVIMTWPPAITAFFAALAMTLAGALATRAAWREGHTADEWEAALVPQAAALCLLCFAAMQVRWAGFATAAALVAWMAPTIALPRRRLGWLHSATATIACASSAFLFFTQHAGVADPRYASADADWQAVRDLGVFMRDHRDVPSPRIMTDSANSNYVWLHDFAGAELVGASYWECVDGMRDTDNFWLAQDDATALEICRRRGVTHVVVTAKPGTLMKRVQVGQKEFSAEAVSKMFIHRLGGPRAVPPKWLEPLPLPTTYPLAMTAMRLFRVVP